ncbi:MAG: RluA family pseudouridine synthase [Planctomycetota bacterium]|nr:RluA family pseudouridine synthase [Planctomycetota bacterium]
MSRPIPILHRDERLLVALKPPGLLSAPERGGAARSLVEVLAEQGIAAQPVHRLDLDVSGAVIFALDDEARLALEALFRERAVKKTYWAMAQGRYQESQGVYRWPIVEDGPDVRVDERRGKPSETRWKVIGRYTVATEMEIDLVTGRRNQIRVHFAHGGHALIGDRRYGRGRDQKLRAPSRRVALHAWRLAFDSPFTGGRLEIEAPLTDDLLDLRSEAANAR